MMEYKERETWNSCLGGIWGCGIFREARVKYLTEVIAYIGRVVFIDNL